MPTAMTSARLPVIDDKGNIFLHGQEDLQLSLNFGTESVGNRQMFFIIEGVCRIPIANNPATPGIRVVQVPQLFISKIPESGAGYALRDETEYPFFVRMDGRIRWYGWV